MDQAAAYSSCTIQFGTGAKQLSARISTRNFLVIERDMNGSCLPGRTLQGLCTCVSGVAKQCIVFNTTEQLDIGQMTRLFMGIAATGAWACFDEVSWAEDELLGHP
jgi:hypothetical protein